MNHYAGERIMLEKKSKTARNEFEKRIKDRTDKLNRTIDSLNIEVAERKRADEALRRMHGVAEIVDTRALLEEISSMLSLSTDVAMDIAPDMPVLHTDRLRLGQVFANLIGNAVKHLTDSQVHIWVTVREKGRFYEFSVADDGPGIAPQYGEKVCMMFQTLTPRDVGNDSGIGLALVKKIVEEKHGLVTLESEDGKGSTFRFTWPKSSV
mgnify:FL=1